MVNLEGDSIIGIFAGSFDPITLGHDHVIQEASKLVDTLYVVVATNDQKTPMFSFTDRFSMAILAVENYPNVIARGTDRLLVDFAKDVDASVLFRGLRYASEYEYELDLSLWNAKIGNISTIGIFPKDLQVSSSAIRLLIRHNKPQWKEYVNPEVARYIDNL